MMFTEYPLSCSIKRQPDPQDHYPMQVYRGKGPPEAVPSLFCSIESATRGAADRHLPNKFLHCPMLVFQLLLHLVFDMACTHKICHVSTWHQILISAWWLTLLCQRFSPRGAQSFRNSERPRLYICSLKKSVADTQLGKLICQGACRINTLVLKTSVKTV